MCVKCSPKLHSLARAGGAEDHLVAVLGLLTHQPRQAGLRHLLRGNIAAASESPTAAASAENITECEAAQEAACLGEDGDTSDGGDLGRGEDDRGGPRGGDGEAEGGLCSGDPGDQHQYRGHPQGHQGLYLRDILLKSE